MSYVVNNLETGKVIPLTKLSQNKYLTSNVLDISYDYNRLSKHFTRKYLLSKSVPVLKFRNLFPLSNGHKIVSLNEGGTPLFKSSNLAKKLGLKNLYFKHEGYNPTGAFKDRGSSIEISKAIEYKSKGIVVASTGNMAASISAYSAYVGLPCYVFVPENTPTTKLAQMLIYGAKIIKIKGSYDDAVSIAKKTALDFKLYPAGDFAFRAEGQKSQAYEIITDLGITSPDYIFVPVGNGTNIYAIWKGFNEFYKMKIIDKLPKMVAVVSSTHNSIYISYKKGLSKIVPQNRNEKTINSAIAVKNPSDGEKVLQLIKSSQGMIISVADKETIKSQIELASFESLFCEPSSATVYSALKKVIKSDKIDYNSQIVCILTGNGLKDPMAGVGNLINTIDIIKNYEEFKLKFGKKI